MSIGGDIRLASIIYAFSIVISSDSDPGLQVYPGISFLTRYNIGKEEKGKKSPPLRKKNRTDPLQIVRLNKSIVLSRKHGTDGIRCLFVILRESMTINIKGDGRFAVAEAMCNGFNIHVR